MIVMDLSQVAYAVVAMEVGFSESNGGGVSTDLIRHMIINSIRANVLKFRPEFGEFVIACDDTSYWRRNVFPYYKAARKKKREGSGLDWKIIYQALSLIREELKENFYYPVIQVEGAEADDIMYTMAIFKQSDPLLIISGDSDFVQLHDLGVRQWNPVMKSWVTGKGKTPAEHLLEKIIKGDTGDGIPNVLSDDDTFVTDKRQTPMTARRLEEYKAALPRGLGETRVVRNYHRNKALIDLSQSSQSLRSMIWDEYLKQKNHGDDIGKSRLLTYFSQHRLRKHMEALSEF